MVIELSRTPELREAYTHIKNRELIPALEAFNKYGIIARGKGDTKEEVRALKNIIHYAGGAVKVNIWNMLHKSFFEKKEIKEAKEMYVRACSRLGEIYDKQKDYEKASEHYLHASKVLIAAEDYIEACVYLEKTANLALDLLKANKENRAKEYLEKGAIVLEKILKEKNIGPERVIVRVATILKHLADIYFLFGNIDRAHRLQTKADELMEKAPVA